MTNLRRIFSPEDLNVRRMVEDDAGVIHDIHCACLTITFRERYTEAQIAAWMKGRTANGYLRAIDAGENFLVASVNERVVGYVSWQDQELLSLFVRPDFQTIGIGSFLLNTCLSEADRQGKPISNLKAAVGAEKFYQKHGFQVESAGSTIKNGLEIEETRMVR